MTLNSFVDRLTQLFSWLYYQYQWEEWELLAVAGVVLIPLLWIARRQRKERAGRIPPHQDRERPPIIGVKLVNGRHSQGEVTDSKKSRSGYLARDKNGQDGLTQEADDSREQIRQLQSEIAKHRQAESRLEQQLAELTATNAKLQHEIDEIKQTEERRRQQTTKLLATNRRLQQGPTRSKRVEEYLPKQADSVPAANRHPMSNGPEDVQAEQDPRRHELLDADQLPPERLNRRDQDPGTPREHRKRSTDSRLANEPLDVEKLKAIAALARQIQERPHPESRQTEIQTPD